MDKGIGRNSYPQLQHKQTYYLLSTQFHVEPLLYMAFNKIGW